MREAEAAEVRKREAAAAAAREAKALESALAARGVRVGEFADDALREQVVGSSSGARVWWDAEQDTLHWPLGMFMGPSWWRRSSPPWPPGADSPGSGQRCALRTRRWAAQGPWERLRCGRQARPRPPMPRPSAHPGRCSCSTPRWV